MKPTSRQLEKWFYNPVVNKADNRGPIIRIITDFVSIIENFRPRMNDKARNKVVLFFPLLNRAAGKKELLFPLLIGN